MDELTNQRQPLPSISSSLLDRVQQMHPDAWARMVSVFSPIVYRWGRQAGLSGADASDVVQDVFISIARRIHSFERQKESGSFRSWLATITRNRVRDKFRQQVKHPNAAGGTAALDQMNQVAAPHGTGLSEEQLSQLEHSISLASLEQKLPRQVLQLVKSDCDERTWSAFWHTVVDGDAAADVAERLEMSIASVYQAKSRILRRLRKRMEEIP